MSGGTRGMWHAVRRLGREHGFELVTSKGHAKLSRPGYRSIPVPSSPSGGAHHALVEIERTLRRARPLGDA